MDRVQRAVDLLVAFLKSYGPSNLKRILWDKEFSGTKWNFSDCTAGDCIYQHIEKHAGNGSILDLGCGTGNTANEVALEAYQSYVGLDISPRALAKASRRTQQVGRSGKNRFVQGDFLGYVPSRQFDVILIREALYHVPPGKIKALFKWYSTYVKAGGVFIVRTVATTFRTKKMLGIIEAEFDVIEKHQYGKTGPTVLIFRPAAPDPNSATVDEPSKFSLALLYRELFDQIFQRAKIGKGSP